MELEKLRAYVRIGILIGFFGLFIFTIAIHTGVADGEIPPETVYSFLTGILVTKLIDFYMIAEPKKEEADQPK